MKVKRLLVVMAAVCVAALAASAQEIRTVATRIRVGGDVMQAKLIAQAQPVYPPLARQARISGIVRLEVGISPDGAVEEAKLISGHPLLVQPAMEAVRQWKYRPTLLNGEPIGVMTTVEVNFGFEENVTLTEEELKLSPEEAADIVRLLELTGAAKSFGDTAKQMAKTMKTGILNSLEPGAPVNLISGRLDEKLEGVLKAENYLKPFVADYAKSFSHQEILELIRFFGTPVGQRYAQVTTQVSSGTLFIAQGRLRVQLDQIAREMREEFPELRKP